MSHAEHDLDTLCVNAIRTLSIDAVQRANSGHPGLPLGGAPMAYALFQRHLRHHPANPDWPDRDRFVLSAGHGSMLIYSLLHLTGYAVSMEDLKNFRQWGANTPGHPESFMTPGVEATTGPLGQGTANIVGMAMAERAMAHRYNRPGHEIINHYTYALAGDGDLMEGVSAEAASLAGHLKLGKLIMLYDANDISLDGPTSLSFTEDVAQRYRAYGWQTLEVKDGNHDLDAIDRAIAEAKAETGRPSLIIVKTTIGYGAKAVEGTSAAHGAPLGEEGVAAAKQTLGWTAPPFTVPEPALARFRQALTNGQRLEADWNARFEAYRAAHPELAEEWRRAHAGELPDDYDRDLPVWEPGKKVATRVSSGKILNGFAANIPWLIGGDADLSCSTKTALAGEDSFDGQTGAGRNIHYGVREHAMGAVANGMAYHRGLIPYTATFLCFADYMRPAIRLAALSHLHAIFVFTHDSVGLGEDGPTHQPVEHVASLRAIPNLWVIRPGDATEAEEAWRAALRRHDGPTVLVFSRQGLPTLDRDRLAPQAEVQRGAYVLSEAPGGEPRAILIATGSEVPLALEAQAALADKGCPTRVVSMPCWELFDQQPAAYRDRVLPPGVRARVAVEAGSTMGWARWVGDGGAVIGVDTFGASAPGGTVMKEYGFTVDNLCDAVQGLVG